MPNEKDVATFKIQIERLTLANKRLVAEKKTLAKELSFAKNALLKIQAGYNARVRSALLMNIQNVLGLSDQATLKLTHGASIEELETMFENFSLAVDSKKSPYQKQEAPTATIRGSSVAVASGGIRRTVGDLSGKTPEEILKMGGEF